MAEDVTPASEPEPVEPERPLEAAATPVGPAEISQPSSEGADPSPQTADIAAPAAADAVPSYETGVPGPEPHGFGATEPASAPTSEPKRSNLAAYALAGVLLLAAGLLYLFSQLASLPPDTTAAVADLRTRVAAVEGRPASDTGGLGERVARLEAGTGEIQTGLDGLGKRLDGMAATAAAQADLAARVADLQSALAGMKESLAAVQTSVVQLPRPDVGKVESRVGDLDQRMIALQAAVTAIPHVDLGPVTGKVDDLEGRLKPIEAEVRASGAPDAVAQRKAAPMAVTAQAISGAIREGQAFPRELRALQALGADPLKVAPLQAVADEGAPSLRDLQATLADLRGRIVSQGSAPAAGSYVDRLMAGASSLVQVRPLGSVVGDTPAAIVARMDAALGADDLAAALSEWKKLPEPSQSASKALADRVRLRLDAETAARDIANNAIGAMATPKG